MRMLVTMLLVPVVLMAGAWAMVTQPVLNPGGKAEAVIEVNANRLAMHVDKLSRTFVPRNSAHPENLDRAAAYISTELADAGGAVTLQPYRVEGNEYRNVIATFGPEDGERLIIGAHYDAFKEYPAADDNASGVAGLIELARRLGATPLHQRVDLIAYTLEEPPHFPVETMGSAVHASSLRRQGVAVETMISLEMIGYYEDAPASQRFPFKLLEWFYPDTGDFIAIVGRPRDAWVLRGLKASMQRASRLPVYSINAPRSVPGIDFSDHRNYWDNGYPALMVTDTAFYRNPNYHSAEDTAATLDYARMAQVVQGVYRWVIERAGSQ